MKLIKTNKNIIIYIENKSWQKKLKLKIKGVNTVMS